MSATEPPFTETRESRGQLRACVTSRGKDTRVLLLVTRACSKDTRVVTRACSKILALSQCDSVLTAAGQQQVNANIDDVKS